MSSVGKEYRTPNAVSGLQRKSKRNGPSIGNESRPSKRLFSYTGLPYTHVASPVLLTRRTNAHGTDRVSEMRAACSKDLASRCRSWQSNCGLGSAMIDTISGSVRARRGGHGDKLMPRLYHVRNCSISHAGRKSRQRSAHWISEDW